MRRVCLLLALALAAAALAGVALSHEEYVAGAFATALCIALGAATARRYRFADNDVKSLLEALRNNDGNFMPLHSGLSRATEDNLRKISAALNHLRIKQEEREQFFRMVTEALDSGVIVVDEDENVLAVNSAALHLLRLEALTSLKRMSPAYDELRRLITGPVHLEKDQAVEIGEHSVSLGVTRRKIGTQMLRVAVLTEIGPALDNCQARTWTLSVRTLAHEIMNTLAPVISIAQTLRDMQASGGDSAEISEGLEAIAALSGDLLRFAESYRELSHTSQAILEPVDLLPLVRRVSETVPHWASRMPAIELEDRSGGALALADEMLTARVLTNIVKNAVEAVQEVENARIRIAVGRIGDSQITIDISNNGPSIAAGDVRNIFTPFYSTRGGGHGIGLPLSRQLMAAQGGNVMLLSRGDVSDVAFRLVFRRDGKPPISLKSEKPGAKKQF